MRFDFLRPGRSIIRLALVAVAATAITVPDSLAQPQQDGQRGGDRQDRAQRGDRGDRGNRGGRGGGMRGGGMRQFMEPEFLRRDMVFFADELDLDKTQNTIVETLLLDYESAFTESMESLRDQFADLRPRREGDEVRRTERRELFGELREMRNDLRILREFTPEGAEPDPTAVKKLEGRLDELRTKMEELRPAMPQGPEMEQMIGAFEDLGKQWRTDRSQLREQFLGGVQAILNEEQIERWAPFQRTLRRMKSLPRGRLSGESVNLIKVIEDMELTEEQQWAIQELTEAYAVALDSALMERDDYLSKSMQEMMVAMMQRDFEQAGLVMSQQTKLRVAVRDVNDGTVEIIAAQLAEQSGDDAASLFDAYREAAYPRIFGRTNLQHAFDVAREMEALDPDVLEAVVALEAAYRGDVQRQNRELLKLTKADEPGEQGQWLQFVANRERGGQNRGWGDNQREESPLRKQYTARRELGERYRGQLEAILGEEHAALLPDIGGRNDRRGRGGGGWGRGGDRRSRQVEQFDRDGDGELSQEERDAARRAVEEKYREEAEATP